MKFIGSPTTYYWLANVCRGDRGSAFDVIIKKCLLVLNGVKRGEVYCLFCNTTVYRQILHICVRFLLFCDEWARRKF